MPSHRAAAVETAWQRVLDGQGSREATRRVLKDLVWRVEEPEVVRVAAMRTLIGDSDPDGAADARDLARLRVPTEPSYAMIELISAEAAGRAWVDLTPALVRSLARVWPEIPDRDRAEYAALQALHPDRTVVETVFGVFVEPKAEDADYRRRTRSDCWNLLARLDVDGSMRTGLLARPVEAGEDGVITDLRAGIKDLKTLPLTGDELTWLRSVRDRSDAANAAWWAEARDAIASLTTEQANRLRLRHAEPVRWASLHRQDWLGATRRELLEELRTRLASRRTHQRTGGVDYRDRIREQLHRWEDSLAWGDLLAILVVDEAVRSDGVRRQVFEYAELDRRDESTEYGGIIESAGTDGTFRALLFPPRPADRGDDNRFVASSDLMHESERALAHFHMHVQRIHNTMYAGPSDGDRIYAQRHGRNCVLFTSMSADVLGADYYASDGVVIDLGEVARPATADTDQP